MDENITQGTSEVTQATSEPTTQAPAQETQQTPQQEAPQQEDLVTRVSKLQADVKPVEKDFEGFDYKELESIQDPVAREQALKAYKSFQKGFNRKFQELAEIKKALEGKSEQYSSWTPERVQQLIHDKNFQDAAKSVMNTYQETGGQLSPEEYSALTDSEKRQFNEMRSQLNMITQQNSKLIQQQQDEKLKGRYANYSPAIVNDMTQQLLEGKYQATREDIWKVIDYEPAVKRAYELGKQDRQLDIGQRQDASVTTTGVNQTPVNDVPPKGKGESNFNYFQRIARRRLEQSRSGQLK